MKEIPALTPDCFRKEIEPGIEVGVIDLKISASLAVLLNIVTFMPGDGMVLALRFSWRASAAASWVVGS